MCDRIDAQIDELKLDGVREVAPKHDPGLGLNEAAAVPECNQEVVVLHVDPSLLPGCRRRDQEGSDHATDGARTLHRARCLLSASSPDSRWPPPRLSPRPRSPRLPPLRAASPSRPLPSSTPRPR